MEPFCQLCRRQQRLFSLCVIKGRFAKPVGFLSHDHFMIPKANIATSCKKTSKRRCWPCWNMYYQVYVHTINIHIRCCCAHTNHTKPFIISIPLKAISNYECMNWVKKNNPKVSFWNSMAKNKDVLYLIFEIRLNDSNTTFFSFTVLWIGSKLWQNLV